MSTPISNQYVHDLDHQYVFHSWSTQGALTPLISVNDLVKTRGDTFAKGIAVSGDGFAAWPVPKSSPELLKFLTDFMSEVRDSGRLAERQTKWFGETFPAMPREPITKVEQFHELAGM